MFLGDGHAQAERRSWAVIGLCGAMMAVEIVGGLAFNSIALVADGLHMSTHAGALLLAALAYSYARKHAGDARFSFGTGKLGDLAGFTSAIVLAMIALLIGYEAMIRLIWPLPIHFGEAIPIAGLGLLVNLASVWLLSGGHHGHAHGYGHSHGGAHAHHDHGEEEHRIETVAGPMVLSVFEDGVPPRFRLRTAAFQGEVTIRIERPDGQSRVFAMRDCGDCLESVEIIPEPHEFVAQVCLPGETHGVVFEEAGHDSHAASGKAGRDNNMRAAIVHVMADALVSVLVIAGLLLARQFGWVWMDPLVGLIGAAVIASWSMGLIRDTGAILLDMNADQGMASAIRRSIEADGDRLHDLHVWRLGPGHLGAIVAVATSQDRGPDYYRSLLGRFRHLSHVTVEVNARC